MRSRNVLDVRRMSFWRMEAIARAATCGERVPSAEDADLR
jgi:hypothetical protein